MAISRLDMERQLRNMGGIMSLQEPRQRAIFGGLKKAVKGVAKGIGSFLKSDLGKAAILGIGAFGFPKIGSFKGFKGLLTGNIPQLGLKELLTQPLILEESEALKVQAAQANELHVVASILEVKPRQVVT